MKRPKKEVHGFQRILAKQRSYGALAGSVESSGSLLGVCWLGSVYSIE